MRVWTVHTPRGPDAPAREGGAPPAARPPVLVREGFAWLAFLLGLPWLLANRLWIEAAAYLGIVLLLATLLPEAARGPALLGLQFLLGAEARDLRRGALARRGFDQTGVVAAPDAEAALARLLEARPGLLPGVVRDALA